MGQRRIQDAIIKTDFKNVSVVSSTSALAGADIELVDLDNRSNRLKMQILTVKLDYDYIFIDTPPSTIVTEAAVLSRFVHGVIIVARQNYTIHESLEKARENLLFADAKILGYILNDISAKKYGYGRYYYRSYRYSYGKYGYGGYGYSYNYGYGDNAKKKTDSDAQPEAQKSSGLGLKKFDIYKKFMTK